MPRASNGVYTLPNTVNPVISDTLITADWANTTLADIASVITSCLDRAGRGAMQANLQMGGFRVTGVGTASADADAVPLSQMQLQVQEGDAAVLTTLSGQASFSVNAGDVTLTEEQARAVRIVATGNPGAPRNINVPAAHKLFIAVNALTSAQTVTFKTPSGTGIALSQGQNAMLYCDGVNVRFAFGSDAGMALLLAVNAAAQRTALGAGATGAALFQAADAAAARAAAGTDIYKQLVREDGAWVTGQLRVINTNQTMNVGTQGHVYLAYNSTESNLTLTQGAGLFLRLSGTLAVGNRTLLPRGMCTMTYVANDVLVVSGDVL